jgi:hypothetical protein
MACDQSVTCGLATGECAHLNRQGTKKLRTLAPEPDEGAMLRFLKQKTFKNYLELLAKERSETERMFILKVLARKEAENHRRAARGRVIDQTGHSICLTDAGRRPVESR